MIHLRKHSIKRDGVLCSPKRTVLFYCVD